jgi:diguanylate cyclase (GGDEF)-like protein
MAASSPAITLVLGETEEECRSVLLEAGPEASIIPITWGSLERGAPEGIAVDAVLCQASPLLAQRRGLLAILRRAYPETPFFSFSTAPVASPSEALGEALGEPLDAHLVTPIAAENLRMLVEREARLRTLTRRYRETLHRVREQSEKLDLLIETAKAANSILEPPRVIQIVMDRTQEFLGAELWSLYLVVEEGEETSLEATRGGLGRELTTTRQPADRGIASWVVRHRRPLSIEDAGRDPRWKDEPERPGASETRALLCIPLTSRGRVIGAVELANKAAGGPFTERDLETLRTMMEPAAITIENALLFKKLEDLSVTDDLTKLYNSRYLDHFLQQEVKRSRRYGFSVSLMFLDLDGFKSVNDRHGHLAGSRTLTEVGKVIRSIVRETDIVSRYGGDEFTVVLPQTGAEGARIIAERVREALAEHVFLDAMGLSVRVTASIGIASFPDHGDTREDLIGHADQAMYRVKERGKNGIEMATLGTLYNDHQ